ncbi:MAG: 8-amino-7-oxononanoate synthase [Mariprofundaceae bacterium]
MSDSRNWFDLMPEDRKRRFPGSLRSSNARIEIEGKTLINFASNDYLGLATHAGVKCAAADMIKRQGFGSGASRFISGDAPELYKLEAELAAWKGYEAALVVGSGYLANVGLLDALNDRHGTMFCDRLNHASLVDGSRLSRARVYRYAHRDVEQLSQMMQGSGNGRNMIITDGVFSMDGDCAPVRDLLDLAVKHDGLLLVDDAHGTGVLGSEGRGLLAEEGISGHQRVIEVGTLGKALGSYGAFILGSSEIIEGLKQRLRSLIYSTALPPCAAAAAIVAIRLCRSSDLLQRLSSNMKYFLHAAESRGITLMPSRTAIQPMILGENKTAMRAASSLREAGFFVPAIRPPTVPEGTSRLRITLSAMHKERHIDALLKALKSVI